MTDVHFYFNVPDKLQYACRLARKAFMQDRPLLLTGAQECLEQLDRMLWHMAASDFVAHELQRESDPKGEAVALAAHAPILLRPRIELEQLPANIGVLLNLWDEVQPVFSHFEHVYELVGTDDGDRQLARQRWRFYQQRGYRMESHDFAKGQA